jgi:hypothetical protein
MSNHCLGESDRGHVRVRLQREEISEGAQNQAVHGESGCKGGEFGREGVHGRLLSKWLLSFDGGILSAILQVFTRYSANDPQFPVNDRSQFTGKRAQSREIAVRVWGGKLPTFQARPEDSQNHRRNDGQYDCFGLWHHFEHMCIKGEIGNGVRQHSGESTSQTTLPT